MADSPSATVILCTRNRPDLLRRAVQSASLALARGAEFIIVEQGEPAAAALCKELEIDAVVVRDTGVGAARARNIGSRRATGDVLLFTDDDCEVPPTWVSDHLGEFSDEEVVASFGVVTGLSRLQPPGGGEQDTDPVSWRGRHRRGALPWNIGHSANMAVRRSAFVAVGGFDERLGPGAPGAYIGEDADLIVRLLDSDGLAVSGVGQPVRHAEWRSDQETANNLVSYERGSGAWIGKTLRSNRSIGGRYLRDRLTLLRGLLSRPGLRDPRLVASSVSAFLRGLIAGFRMGPWPARDHNSIVR
jgi:glycosyltransferase involved in cell wall biosynthesis